MSIFTHIAGDIDAMPDVEISKLHELGTTRDAAIPVLAAAFAEQQRAVAVCRNDGFRMDEGHRQALIRSSEIFEAALRSLIAAQKAWDDGETKVFGA